jgi:hypothetical protein
MTHPVPGIVYNTSAVFSTLVWEPGALDTSASIEARTGLVHDSARKLGEYRGPVRILSNSQITVSTLDMHRKGLVAQIVGKVQNTPIYAPMSIAQGVDFHNMNFSTFWPLFMGLVETLGIPVSVLQIVLAEGNYNPTTGCNSVMGTVAEEGIVPVPALELEQYAQTFLANFLAGLDIASGGFIHVNDGLTLSFETDNLLPLEAGLPIKRAAPPSKLATMDPALVANDPFARLASKQAAAHNSSLFGLPTTRKKKGQPQAASPAASAPAPSPQPKAVPAVPAAQKAAPRPRRRKASGG